MNRFFWPLFLIGCLMSVGCGEPTSPAADPPPHQPPAELGAAFDPGQCGSLAGRVMWNGAVPDVPKLAIYPSAGAGKLLHERHDRPNPNKPIIDPQTNGVGNAIVFLRNVDLNRSKPWDLPPVEVEVQEGSYHLLQGGLDSRLAIVRRGEPVSIVNRDPCLHSCRAGGAAFFSLPFPDPDKPLKRIVPNTGVVEWTSGVGYYWMRAYMLVGEHPYYARTSAQGHFELKQIPAGSYEVICWLPNWNKDRHERDAESALICRYFFKPPFELKQRVTIEPGRTADLAFDMPPAK